MRYPSRAVKEMRPSSSVCTRHPFRTGRESSCAQQKVVFAISSFRSLESSSTLLSFTAMSMEGKSSALSICRLLSESP